MNQQAKIEIGRRVRHHGAYWNDQEGVIVAVQGQPGGPAQDRRLGPMTMVNPAACTYDVITFDGVMHRQCRESCIGRPGIGRIDLLDRIHGPAMIERAHRLVAERIARDNLEQIQARENFEAAEAARVIVDAPVFYWNGIKDAKGEKIQRAWYSPTSHQCPEGTINISARDYSRFSEKVRACFAIRNDTDIQSDYFDSDRILVIPRHPLYPQVLAAMNAQNAHSEKRIAKRNAR